jgi:hypothetical protein
MTMSITSCSKWWAIDGLRTWSWNRISRTFTAAEQFPHHRACDHRAACAINCAPVRDGTWRGVGGVLANGGNTQFCSGYIYLTKSPPNRKAKQKVPRAYSDPTRATAARLGTPDSPAEENAGSLTAPRDGASIGTLKN